MDPLQAISVAGKHDSPLHPDPAFAPVYQDALTRFAALLGAVRD